MGADLILIVLETGKAGRLRFARARKKLEKISDNDLVEGLCGALQLGRDRVWETYVKPEGGQGELFEGDEKKAELIAKMAKRYAEAGLDTMEEMWKGLRRDAVVVRLKNSRALITGSRTWGDPPFDGYDEFMTALGLGLHKEAGFW